MARRFLVVNPDNNERCFLTFENANQARNYCDQEGLFYQGMELFRLHLPLSDEDGVNVAKRVNKNYMDMHEKLNELCSYLDDHEMCLFFNLLDDIFNND